mmetsp:Transcript_33440/g.51997  ORF Transcript_33440/g.51997 Transcript_33440/m.51997 type:complete len:165 (-) Transcript_33440:36-530(-)
MVVLGVLVLLSCFVESVGLIVADLYPQVPIPNKPTASLPEPHGHPQGSEVLPRDHPARCKKLVMCFSAFGESATGFKACIKRFCKRLSEESFHSPEHSELCKDDGETAWSILSKLHPDSESAKEKEPLVTDLGSLRHLGYAEALHLVVQSAPFDKVTAACDDDL